MKTHACRERSHYTLCGLNADLRALITSTNPNCKRCLRAMGDPVRRSEAMSHVAGGLTSALRLLRRAVEILQDIEKQERRP